MDSIQCNYHSYLLRLWQVREETTSHWRASLEDVQTYDLLGFQDLATLHSYLGGLAFPDQMEESFVEPKVDREGLF